MSVAKIMTGAFCILALIVGFVLGGITSNFRFEKVVAERDELRKDLLYNIQLVAETQDSFFEKDMTIAKLYNRIEFLEATNKAIINQK